MGPSHAARGRSPARPGYPVGLCSHAPTRQRIIMLFSASHAGMKRTCRQVRYSVANGGKAAADSRKPKASGRLLCTAASCAMLVPMARFLPVLKHRRCPTCRSLYEYSERPNSLGLAAPTECFCSVCGDLVAAWSDDQIRVYIFVASEEQVHQAQNSQLRT